MKVYLVGQSGCEWNIVLHVCKTKELALKKFNEVRIKLLEDAQERLEFWKNKAKEELDRGTNSEGKPLSEDTKNYLKKRLIGDDMYIGMYNNLLEENPEKIDNYPHETPYINEMELESL